MPNFAPPIKLKLSKQKIGEDTEIGARQQHTPVKPP
jgi:hypothetical protein